MRLNVVTKSPQTVVNSLNRVFGANEYGLRAEVVRRFDNGVAEIEVASYAPCVLSMEFFSRVLSYLRPWNIRFCI